MAGINEEEAAARSINPLLLEAARKGFWEALDFLFQREDAQEPPMVVPTEEFRAVLDIAYRRIGVSAPPDAELSIDHQPAPLAAGAGAGALLQGVTPDGDTALHVVASNGNDQDFFKCARMVCRRDRSLLFAKNHNGDTPLHCARRADNHQMVSYLIDLAGREAAPRDINPLLLLSARVGSWKALKLLFDGEDPQDPPMMIPTKEFLASLAIGEEPAAAPDLEHGVPRPVFLAVGQLLQGVTPDGDSVLHAVAGSGDGENFLKYAAIICGMDRDLLFTKNYNGDTPLHCAARAGNSKMVSRLIDLAGPGAGGEHPDGKLKLLRMENKRHETALHEAIRIEDGRILDPKDREALFQADHATAEKIRDFVRQQKGMTIVKQLMAADPGLAKYPAKGVSPLCLAILLEKGSIALTLYHESGGDLSYSGADGQNALHVALRRDKDTVMVELVLNWNKNLTTKVDKDGSTPLHFALAMKCSPTLQKVLKANPAALYQADKEGFFPIHVAASVGASDVIRFLLQKHPDNAGLRDAKGKTFLHVATEKARREIVRYACGYGYPSLPWILNIQDNDGNTALHLAIRDGSLEMFCALFGNPDVNLNLTNNQGDTAHDLSRSKLPRGLGFGWNPENRINHALKFFGANHGSRRRDKNEEKYSRRPKAEDEHKESEKLKDTAQNYIVPAVLIATMAFTATFGIPGGYRADDSTNGGTPTLAGRYIFDAFIMATTLAFICSALATIGYMFAGHPVVNLTTRTQYLIMSTPLMASAVACLAIAFALAVYMVLAPITLSTAIVVCVLITPVPLFLYMWNVAAMIPLARSVLTRNGPKLGMPYLLNWSGDLIASLLWPYIVTFGWAAFARIKWHREH
ncbi:hypothetical protein ACQ4PT_030346 [Festuca glaucescens]